MEFLKKFHKNLYMTDHYLVCAITGKTRKTTPSYLDKVCGKHKMTVEEYKRYYISREAAVLLNAGKTVEEIRAMLPKPPTNEVLVSDLDKMRSLNVTKRKVSRL